MIQKKLQLYNATKTLQKEAAPRVLFRRVENNWLAGIGRILLSDSDSVESKIYKIVKMSESPPDEQKFYAANPGNI